MKLFTRALVAACMGLSLSAATAQAGPIFLTGHDPDFHTQAGAGATLLRTGLTYALGGTFNDDVHKLLWVESFTPVTGGHLVGAHSLDILGLTAGVDYDWVDAAGFAALTDAQLASYSAIGVASSFGGMLQTAELNTLIARKTDIASFINAGGGLFASAECIAGMADCDGSNLAGFSGSLFGFLPITAVSVSTAPPYSVTAFGASLGLTNGDLNDPTHNSFGAVGGLNIVDIDLGGHATTLAGVVGVDDRGFTPTPVPEPGTLTLLGLGLAAAVRRRLRR